MVRPAENNLGSAARLRLSCPVKRDIGGVVHVG
jgi:hypothetical protein